MIPHGTIMMSMNDILSLLEVLVEVIFGDVVVIKVLVVKTIVELLVKGEVVLKAFKCLFLKLKD